MPIHAWATRVSYATNQASSSLLESWKALPTSASNSTSHPRLIWLHTWMLTGPFALIRLSLLLGFVFFLGRTWSHGLLKDKPRWVDQVPKQNTEASPIVLPSHVGLGNFFMSSYIHLREPLLCIVTTSANHISRATRSNINEQNILRSIYTSFAIEWPLVKLASCMFLRSHNLQICSLRVYLRMFFMSFIPALTSYRMAFRLRGGGVST